MLRMSAPGEGSWAMRNRAQQEQGTSSEERCGQTLNARGRFRVDNRLLTHIVLVLLSLPALMPLIWMVSTSLKTDSQIFPREGQNLSAFAMHNLIPHPIKWQNYSSALAAIPLITYLRNTLRLCLFNVVGAVFSSSIVAYGFARLEFIGKNVLFLIMISTMALPGQVTMIPVFVVFRWLGWYGILPAANGVQHFLAMRSLSSCLRSSTRHFRRTLVRQRAWMAQMNG